MKQRSQHTRERTREHTFRSLGGGVLLLSACSSASLAMPEDRDPFASLGDASVGHDSSGGVVVPALEGGRGDVATLEFDPPSATLDLDGTSAKSASFALRAHLRSGAVEVVTADAVDFDRPDLGTLSMGSGVVVTSVDTYAGLGTLHALYHGVEALAQVTVRVHLRANPDGVDATRTVSLDAAAADAKQRLDLLYPFDGTVFPLGLSAPLLMWTPPSSKDSYRVHLEQANYTYDAYTQSPPNGQWRIEQSVWDRMSASNRGEPLQMSVARYSEKDHASYRVTEQQWTIAPASLRGAIYYWTTSGGGHTSRIRPGTGAKPEILNGGKCMGCHAVSADGTTLVASVEGAKTTDGSGDNRAWASYTLPDMKSGVVSSTFAGMNVAVSPEGKFTVSGWPRLSLSLTATAERLSKSGLEAMPVSPSMSGLMMPAFSPDGLSLAAVETNGDWDDPIAGDLLVMDFDPKSATFSRGRRVAGTSSFPAGRRAIAYPSFTPDNRALAFHVGDYPTGCRQWPKYCGETTRQSGSLWYQPLSGSAPVLLDRLSSAGGDALDHDVSFEPTWNPVERAGYHWVVFTSMRSWGNRVTGAPTNAKKRLWVAAVDTTSNGMDPSHPPFFLEGQEEETTNMRGFWSLAACVASGPAGACSAGFECCSGFCDQGTCVDVTQHRCKGVGEGCGASSECCNGAQTFCDRGKCAVTDVH